MFVIIIITLCEPTQKEDINKTMTTSSVHLLHLLITRRREPLTHTHRLKLFFLLMPTTLALVTSLLVLLYIFSTSSIFLVHPVHHRLHLTYPTDFVNREKPTKDFNLPPPKSVNSTQVPCFSCVLGRSEDQNAQKLHLGYNGMSKIPSLLDILVFLLFRTKLYSMN